MIREYVVKVTDALVSDAFQRFENEWAPEQELIRCKDCKHWKDGYLNRNVQPWLLIHPRCDRNGGGWLSDDYCSCAERREK